ncbi:somatolactin alpha [Clupea harengus]|uniref:Somatolactin alpha n=1 Tax=Clupea harengus TaxID=7950 RepID=A0A8M1KQ99_CLUHA|nr:somatolactin alpha [Clupea harengus]
MPNEESDGKTLRSEVEAESTRKKMRIEKASKTLSKKKLRKEAKRQKKEMADRKTKEVEETRFKNLVMAIPEVQSAEIVLPNASASQLSSTVQFQFPSAPGDILPVPGPVPESTGASSVPVPELVPVPEVVPDSEMVWSQGRVCTLLLALSWGALALPLDCKDESGSLVRCTSISQEKLLDRVIQHAELIYRVSEESCSMFEDLFVPFPMRTVRSQAGSTCITKPFPIPASKSEIQQTSDKWLLHSVLVLVQSWIEPLLYLQTTLNHYDSAPDALLNKTKWVADKLLSLEQGLLVLIRKMLNEGMLMPSVYEPSLMQSDLPPAMLDSILRDYSLLTCFKKDAHKIETFLKLLKCRQSDNLSCLVY